MPNFKVGDNVKCVSSAGMNLKRNSTYEVIDIKKERLAIIVYVKNNIGEIRGFPVYFFKRIDLKSMRKDSISKKLGNK